MNAPKDYPMGIDAQKQYVRTVLAVLVLVGVIAWTIYELANI